MIEILNWKLRYKLWLKFINLLISDINARNSTCQVRHNERISKQSVNKLLGFCSRFCDFSVSWCWVISNLAILFTRCLNILIILHQIRAFTVHQYNCFRIRVIALCFNLILIYVQLLMCKWSLLIDSNLTIHASVQIELLSCLSLII